MNSELDRMFEHSMSNLSRAPQAPLTDEQITTAAKASKTGAVLWLRMHTKEILLCVISLSVGIAGTLLIVHFAINQGNVPEPVETVAAVAGDTVMVADDNDVHPAESTTSIVETRRAASSQNDQSVNISAKPSTEPATTSAKTRRAASLQTNQPVTTSAKSNTEPTTAPVIVKKTIVQRDTVVINETVTVKDTVYLIDH